MDRRKFIASVGTLGGIAALGLANPGDLLSSKIFRNKRRKNVLFIAVDDLRPELGCYGHPLIKSPNIDKLATRGVLFEKAYCQQAVCGPTRASLLTGKRPDTTKVYDLKTHIRDTMPDVVTLQQFFKNNGYYSEGIGKLFHSGMEDEQSYSVPHRYPKAEEYALPENESLKKKGGKVSLTDKGEATEKERMRGPATECADVPDNKYADGVMAEMAIESLRKLAPKAKSYEQPFFLGLGFRKPHLPFIAPKKYWDLYKRESIAMPYPDRPKNAPEIAFSNWAELRSYSDIPEVGDCDEAKTKELIHGYYACVSYTDAQIGKILDELDRLDLRKDTIVVLWGDHGWKLGEYSDWCKHTNFELDTHVPLILSDPDHKKGIKTKALTEFVDIYPTLTELCGMNEPDGLEGISTVPIMVNPDRKWKKAAFSQYPRGKKIMGYSLRTEQYRYTEWVEQKTKEVKYTELYDLINDPICKENISVKSENSKLIEELHIMMQMGWQGAKP